MRAGYQVWICDTNGTRLGMVSDFLALEYSLVQNDSGWAKVTIPYDRLDPRWIGVDYIIEIERKPSGGSYDVDWVGFLRKWRFYDDPQGDTMAELGGPHMMELLDRRIIAYETGGSGADKSEPADDMMKSYVRENAGEDAPLDYAGRPRSYGNEFTTEAAASAGQSIDRQAGWKYLLETLQQISLTTLEKTPPIYFDLDYQRSGGLATFQFRTHTNQLGTDRSSGVDRVIFSRARENLRQPDYEVDWSEERNFVYGLGPGKGESRIIDPEKDLRRQLLNKWSRREDYQDARGETDEYGVAARAFEKLQAMRPHVRFSAELIDTDQHPYGVEWFFGDKVTAEYLGHSFVGNVTAVSVKVDQSGEDEITAYIESDTYYTGVGGYVYFDMLYLASSAQALTVSVA